MLQGVLKKFLMDKIPLHITAIYALQVFAYNNGSPKGNCPLNVQPWHSAVSICH